MISRLKDGVVAEIFKNVAVDVELLRRTHIEVVEKRDEVAKSGFLDLAHIEAGSRRFDGVV